MSTERKRAQTRANIFVASDVFFYHVLRIELSDGAKHSPPGGRGPPDCLWTHPPVDIPGPPLANDISGSSSSNESFSICIPIIFNVLSCGFYTVSPSLRDLLRYLQVLANFGGRKK